MQKVDLEIHENKKRWKSFRETSFNFADVRKNELQRILEIIEAGKIEPSSSILEVGTGGCYLTFPLARLIKSFGGQLSTADVDQAALEEFLKKKQLLEKCLKSELPIESCLISDSCFEQKKFPNSYCEKFDIVTSLATFHHFDSRASHIKSGTIGRTNALKEFFSMIKPGGRLVLSDVCHGSSVQEYFDAIDNPIHFYPNGHPHDFFTAEQFKFNLEEAGFSIKYLAVEQVPWIFKTQNDCMNFLSGLHNARCSSMEILEIANRILGFKQKHGRFELNWQLLFIEALKK
ncbi:MAG: class I SAM-dependent methyltransferase [Pseudobdellovibrionaceae bacterium]